MLLDDRTVPEVKVTVPKVKVDEVGQLLLAAADRIEKHGWCQFSLADTEGRLCAVGAIYDYTKHRYYGETPARLAEAAAARANRLLAAWGYRLGDRSGDRLVEYNNAKGRTSQEVVSLLREAATFTG